MKVFTNAVLALMGLVVPFMLTAQNAWINEIHYDNTGTDQGEFIEVVIENASLYSLGQFKVTLYNGNNGASYDTDSLTVFTQGSTYGNYTFYYYTYPSNGIQNGGTATSPAPDGVALSYQGVLIPGQFLSYEGVMAAVDGPAMGITSTDILVSEDGTNAVGTSLQLTGNGAGYAQFTWQGPITASSGTLNLNQTLGTFVPDPEPSNHVTAFSATAQGLGIALSWTDAVGTQLPSAYLILASETTGFAIPNDGVPVVDDLDLSDGQGARNVLFGVQSASFSGLDPNTTYYFLIVPYTNSGTFIDYKTALPIPVAFATTPMVVNSVKFDNLTFGNWDTISVASDKNWFIDTYNNDTYAKISGYQGNVPSEDWLISPALPLDNYSNEALSFITAKNYAGPDLEVLYSTNYSGNGNPASATWMPLTATLSSGSWAWTPSGSIDLSGIIGAAYIAFRYTSTATDASTWELDDVVITGNPAGSLNIAINEFLADNEQAYMDPSDNEYDDWIELYNPTTSAVNLLNWSLTDDPGSGDEWYFPDTTIPAGGYLIVWADEDTTDPGLHASFSISNNGEDLVLYDAIGNTIDSVSFGAQYEDTTFARIPDGFGPWYLAMPTPMAQNALFPVIVVDTVPPVVLSAVAVSATEVTVIFNEAVGISAENVANYTGIGSISSAARSTDLKQVTLSLGTPLANGQLYTLVISSIADTTGNVMTAPTSQYIVFGNVTADLVITEIMYNPPEVGTDTLEYVEVYNRGNAPVPLQDFYFSSGITFVFPNVVMQPGDFFVIGDNPSALINTLGAVNVFQWSASGLSNSGELLVLRSPSGAIIDSVSYADVAPWPTAPDGNGPSLVLCNPALNNADPANWTVSVEFAGLNAAGDSIFGTPGGPCTGSGFLEHMLNAIVWNLYPVPASGQVSFVLPAGEWDVVITDLSGRTMISRRGIQDGQSITLDGLNPGMYLVSILDADAKRVGVRKLVVD
jgi:hypothetical protein